MHEPGNVQEVVGIVAAASRSARARRIVLEIGSQAAVLPDALRFCFDLATG